MDCRWYIVSEAGWWLWDRTEEFEGERVESGVGAWTYKKKPPDSGSA